MRNGFTLVELSIVLVIIGMLVGGILVGQTLVDAARLNSLVQQLQQYDAATFSFKSKFKSLPGDSRLGFTVAVCCGTDAVKDNLITDNDRINDTLRFALAGSEEYMLYWLDLVALSSLKIDSCQNMLTRGNAFAGGDGIRTEGANCNFPKVKYGTGKNTIVAASYDTINAAAIDASNADGNAFYLVNDCQLVGATPNFTCTPGFTHTEAIAFDGKVDDGKSSTGEVEAFSNTSYANFRRANKTIVSNYDTSLSTKVTLVRKFAKGLK